MKDWLKRVGIKVLKTMAETALGVIGASYFINEVNWLNVLYATLLSGIVTILINIKDIKEQSVVSPTFSVTESVGIH